ncbi:MAG TPA: four helix bundle protein [Kofleriaceae bacterium]|nr:four helix bundle protein [Kofleriaceae bacterium]
MTLSEKLSIDLIHALRPVVAALRSGRHAALADELERAGSGTALNIAEAHGRAGRDSRRVLGIALGECPEARRNLQVAVAWGWVGDALVAEPASIANRLGGVLFGILRKAA